MARPEPIYPVPLYSSSAFQGPGQSVTDWQLSVFMPFDVPQEITTEVNHFLPLFKRLSEGPYWFGSSAKKNPTHTCRNMEGKKRETASPAEMSPCL